MSARETLLVALQDKLSPLLPASVWRNRKEQLPTTPAIVIRLESESDEGQMLGCRDAVLSVAIEIYSRGETPDQAADDLLEGVIDILDADSTLGLGSDVQVMPVRNVEWAIDHYDDVAVTLRLLITYRTFP